jgi:outer membrane protein OmpA-like peptidoglycan-associated protein
MPAFQGPEIIVRVRGKVFDSKTLKTVDASIEFIQESEKEVRELTSSDSSGYKIILPHEFKYKILCRAEGYYNANDSISLMGITVSKEIIKDIYVDPIVKNKAIVFDNLYFEFDSDKLKSRSFPALDEVVEMLLDNPDIHISVNGHTCSLGSDAYNQRLSEKRARAVTRYLEEHGVDASRLEYHGYGESRPIASNDTEAGREINRRVEFELTDKMVADK